MTTGILFFGAGKAGHATFLGRDEAGFREACAENGAKAGFLLDQEGEIIASYRRDETACDVHPVP